MAAPAQSITHTTSCVLRCSSGQSQRSASLSGTRGQPAAPAALPGPPKAAGWGNGELAQPGTLMMDNDEDLDELEVSQRHN